MRLRGRVALVTGCGPNINAGIAYGLAEEGAKLVCVDRLTDYAEACARALRNRGAEAVGLTCDVTREDEVRSAVVQAEENLRLVRVKYEDFQVTVRYLMPEDRVEDGGEKILYQLNFPRTIDERINGKKRFFGNADYLNPRQEFRHRYITSIPEDGTFVWVQCKFLFTPQKNVKMNSQRIFRVPAGEVAEIAAIKPASTLL